MSAGTWRGYPGIMDPNITMKSRITMTLSKPERSIEVRSGVRRFLRVVQEGGVTNRRIRESLSISHLREGESSEILGKWRRSSRNQREEFTQRTQRAQRAQRRKDGCGQRGVSRWPAPIPRQQRY